MRIFTSLLFCWLACVGPSSDNAQPPPTEDMNSDFSDVLRIARSSAIDAREQLRTISESAKDEDIRLAARRILSLWNDQERTYFSKVPLPLRRACVDEAALALVRPKIDESKAIELELRITESGEVQSVTFTKGSGRGDVDEIVEDSLRAKRFLPAKSGNEYRTGDLRVNCWIEVR